MADDEKVGIVWGEDNFPAEILPDNDRTAGIMKIRQEKEMAEKEQFERLQKMKENDDKKKRQREKQEMLKKQQAEKNANEAAAMKALQDEQMNKLEGRMYIMLNKLQSNTTPFEYTISGLELGGARCRILAQNIAFNETLLSLHVARKQIIDHDGLAIASMLANNSTLRKLEMEGNNLGPHSAFAFGRVLETNTTLKFLDLESNQLTNDGADFKGVLEMLNFLDKNTTLRSLNISNNQLNEDCGAKLREKLQHNKTLIDLDFSMNQFNIEDSRAIQDYLKRNKALYDAERLKEWKERKLMRYEDQKLKELYLQQQSNKEQGRMDEEQGEIREIDLSEKWKKFMLETELEKQQIITQLTEAAILRQTKGKKKGKKKGGKKK